ncbi:protein CHUP1, chloroplastic-like [Musa troglodytarum]|uniref:Protein CHUP1, chloroplastic-like n=2 Tax=Musa troglodytarum TaxID=320322 RepID=A0A9E7JNS4_9LILI|nr:protein CHUP1, chloroplastic-like [Musa troglodytarum]
MSAGTDNAAAGGGRRCGEQMELVVRGKRDVKSMLVRVGIATALSLAGFVVSQLRPHPRPSLRPPSRRPSPSAAAESKSGERDGGGCLQKEVGTPKTEEDLMEIINGTAITATGEEAGFLLPGFDDLVMQEFEVTRKDLQTTPFTTMPEKPVMQDRAMMEQEITNLKELVLSLQEREWCREQQLLDYHGLKGQEAVVRELVNRLKISSMEAKLYMLKIESLQVDNQRLQAQLEDCAKAISELDAAREHIKLLDEKLESDRDKAKEIMASLHQRISSLQQREQKNVENDAEVKSKLKKLEELEHESMELRMINSRLAEENSDLARKLKSTQNTASAVREDAKAKAVEEANRFRKANEKLMEEIEQLQIDRCTDVEELVYLRWVNACLRYELKNHQPPSEETLARDISKSLSIKSEKKAKQLILEYANLSADEKGSNFFEVNSNYSSSSQASSRESEDTSIDDSSLIKHGSSNKAKFLNKLKKLVLGKGKHTKKVSAVDKTTSSGNSERRASFLTCSFDDVIGRDSYDSSSSYMIEKVAAVNSLAGTEAQRVEGQHNKDVFSQNNSSLSLDIQRLQELDLEEATEEKGLLRRRDRATSCDYMKISVLEHSLISCERNPLDQEKASIPEKVELKKFADALRISRGIPKLNRRSASSRY